MTFTVLFKAKQAMAYDGNVMTASGTPFWPCVDSGGWVEATGRECSSIPPDVLTFDTREAAETWASSWLGHPWYYEPRKAHRVLEIEPVTRTITEIVGFREVVK